MTPEQFDKLIKKKAKEIESYVNVRFPSEAGNTAIRFINGNFRAQGYQGASFKKWKPNKRGGTTLVHRGHLRAASYYTTAPGMAIVKNTMPYAKIHNEGGTTTIPITPKMRRFAWAMYYKEGKGDASNRWRALALTRNTELNIKIEQRQFAPLEGENNPVLGNAITRKISQELKRIFSNQ